MPRDQTFRIFISSTFSDMTVERETLREDVFPRLRDLCRTHGARFQAIDLRWGISEAASRDHQIMPVCFQEIARSQRVSPRLNFIALLGDRYGSYILPPEIPAGEMKLITGRITGSKAGDLVSRWYHCDDNAKPPTYCLSSRSGEDQEIWETKTEPALWQALREGIAGLDLPEENLLKYEASATHQEIYRGVFNIPDAHQHAFAFFRSPLPNGSGPVPEDAEKRRKLAALKKRLKSSLGRKSVVRFKDQKDLASVGYDALARVILAELLSVVRQDPVEQEAQAHRNFGIERSAQFIGRPDELKAIQNKAAGEPRIPCCVRGVPGAGKTAVMAQAIKEFQNDDPRRVVVGRFIGATPASSSAILLFDGLSAEISRRYAPVDAGASNTFQAAVERLHGSLALARWEKPLAIFLDAVDQLSDADFARKLDWLPARLPQHASLIVSASPGECLDALQSKLPESQFVEVGDMANSEGKELLKRWLDDANRGLQDAQWSKLMDHFKGCPLPLYLKLAFERIRALHSYDEAPALGSDLPDAIGALFDHLRQDAKHGRKLVSCALGYLYAARYGLTEDELLDLLSRGGQKDEIQAEVRERSEHWPKVAELPFVLWSRLYFDLEHYLTERSSGVGSLLGFYHQLFKAAAKKFPEGGGAQARHAEIADYFAGQPNRYGGVVNIRKVTELPYQQSHAGPRHNVDETLTDLDFAEAKIGVGLLYDLIRDCDLALSAGPLPGTAAVRAALAFELSGLSREPQRALQALYNRLHFGQPPEKIAAKLTSTIGKLDSQPLWLAADAPLPGARVRVAFGIHAAWQWLSFKKGVIAGASTDGELELRDITTGDLVARRSLPSRGVRAIASAPGSGRIAWLDKDGAVRVEGGGVLLRARRGDERLVWHPAAGLIAVREDGALVACDIDTGGCVILAQHLPLSVSILRLAGRSQTLLFAAGENDQLVGVVVPDAPSSNRAEFRFSGPPIVDADFDPETQRLLLLTQDACLRLVDLDGNRELAQLRYERLPAPIVRGRPERCALYLGASGCHAYLSTDHGHVARWDWTAGTVERLEDYMQVGDPDFVRIFEVSSDSGELFLSTASWGAFWGASERFSRSTRHATSVSMCCFTRNGQVVCASRAGYTICWSTPRLELVFQSVYRGFTAIGPGYDTDNIIIGDDQGRIWSVSPRGESRDAAVIFGEAVIAVFGDSDGSAIAADGSGRVLRVPLWAGNESQILATSNGYRQQQRILRASKSGQCWSLRRESRAGGQQTVLSLMEVGAREKVVLRTVELFRDAAVTEDGSIICLAGDSVRILHRRFWRGQTLYQRPTPVSHVAFTGRGNCIVVVPAGESRLEVWRLAEGLSTIGAIELQGRVTCLTTAGDRIVAGLRSGEVLSLQLRGTAIGRSE